MLKDYSLDRPEEIAVRKASDGRRSIITLHWNICEDWIETGLDSKPVRFFESDMLTLTCDCAITGPHIRRSFPLLWARKDPKNS